MDEYEQILKDRKPYFKAGMKFASEECFQRASFIASLLNDDYKIDSFLRTTTEQAMEGALEYLTLFNDNDLLTRLLEITKGVPIYYSSNPVDYSTGIIWSDIKKDKCLTNKTGRISEFTFSEISTDMSRVFIGHEMIHAFKDTFGREIIDHYITGEVLPMFFELAILEKEDPLFAKKHHSYRLAMLKEDKQYLDLLITAKYSKKVYQIAVSEACEYLNAFYFSLLLYNAYKMNRDLVIYEVLSVLYQEKTTWDILGYLGILTNNQEKTIVKEEFKAIRKLALQK